MYAGKKAVPSTKPIRNGTYSSNIYGEHSTKTRRGVRGTIGVFLAQSYGTF